jgi:hypothetical protein
MYRTPGITSTVFGDVNLYRMNQGDTPPAARAGT